VNKYGDFVAGPGTTGEPEDAALRRLQVRQEAVDGARLLLRALEQPNEYPVIQYSANPK
jgi:hypothetical protein